MMLLQSKMLEVVLITLPNIFYSFKTFYFDFIEHNFFQRFDTLYFARLIGSVVLKCTNDIDVGG